MALAFWFKKSNMAGLKTAFDEQRADKIWLGRGLVFHIAPSNVDTIFVYSLFLSMLVGNINIVRLSSTSNEQLDALLTVINKIAESDEFSAMRRRFMIVRYEHDERISAEFSQVCDIRVIWGGDETIRRIRAIPLKPTAIELTFADKFSFCLIKAAEFLVCPDPERVINSFYNDAYTFDQNACSSPRLVVWVGDDKSVAAARDLFWSQLKSEVNRKLTEPVPGLAMNRLVAQYSVAAEATDEVSIVPPAGAPLDRVLLTSPVDIKRALHCGGGLFYEYIIGKLAQLADLITAKDQTISSYGFDRSEMASFIADCHPAGIDRIVPIGQALDFSVIWDGHDLLREFCREIDLRV
jgi:hypothetical protein